MCRVLYFIVKSVCYSKKRVFLRKKRKTTALSTALRATPVCGLDLRDASVCPNIPEPSQKDIFHVTSGYALNMPLRKGPELALWSGHTLITEYMIEDLAQLSSPQVETGMHAFNCKPRSLAYYDSAPVGGCLISYFVAGIAEVNVVSSVRVGFSLEGILDVLEEQ